MSQPTIHDAVRVVYSNAISIWGNDVNSLQVFDINNSPITIDVNSVNSAFTTLESNYTAQQATQEQHKQNAISKLTSLGLTADEISALVG
jgi:hypothetical protein